MAIRGLGNLLANMEPTLNPGRHAFVVAPEDVQVPQADHRFDQGSGGALAGRCGVPRPGPRPARRLLPAWITLTVHSDLAAVGMTAAFSGALGRAGIGCNVVAGTHHDHLFVPAEQARRAMDVLARIQASATRYFVDAAAASWPGPLHALAAPTSGTRNAGAQLERSRPATWNHSVPRE